MIIKKTDKEIENRVIELYNKKISSINIGKELNINPQTVLNILKRNNIKTRTKGGIDDISINEIKTMYVDKRMTLQEISNIYNVCIETIRRKLKNNNIQIRSKNETYNPLLKDDYFENIDTEYKAYYLGLIIADGNIKEPDIKNNKPNYQLRISLKKDDAYILEELRKDIGLSSSLQYDKRGCVTISVTSNKICEDLSKYGVIPRKTWKTYLPVIKEELMPHLIRGIIDGDGWFSMFKTPQNKRKTVIGICGNEELILNLKEHLVKKLNIFPIKITERNKLYSIAWGKLEDVKKISNYIYNNANVYLKRKKEIADKFFNI